MGRDVESTEGSAGSGGRSHCIGKVERREELVDSELRDAMINEIIHGYHLQEEEIKMQADRL